MNVAKVFWNFTAVYEKYYNVQYIVRFAIMWADGAKFGMRMKVGM